MSDRRPLAGKVVALWRYPIKSMQGEQVLATTLVNGSLLGDRALPCWMARPAWWPAPNTRAAGPTCRPIVPHS